jgi:hemoglobin-like flavoprotein
MLTAEDRAVVVHSWRLVVPIAETAADLFYRRLFELKPEYRALFPDDMAKQKRKLVTMLAFIVKAMDWMEDDWQEEVAEEDDLCLVVLAMGRRHTSLYKIPDASYDTVGAALLWTLDQGLGEAFTDEVRAAWTKLYGVVATTMKVGGRASQVDIDLGRVA